MRIGVCSDIHGYGEPLRRVLREMKTMDERWCLGDLIGGGPDASEVVELARRSFDLCLLGNHDAWMLHGSWWPEDARALRGRQAVWMSSLKPHEDRWGIHCWHGSPSNALLGFFEDRELYALPDGDLGFVGHSHEPSAWVRDGSEVSSIEVYPGRTVSLDPMWAVVANPGAVGDGEAAWWLEYDMGEDSLRWHRSEA